ncbi:MAG TPA: hypothetical protein VLX44_09105 [Xanthobacteraceae bacterium]|nr:hypothetical protein [Xanthobacteraceae bacterium]
MDQPIIIDALDIGGCESVPRSDMFAMLSMIDYLIAQVGSFDEMSASYLVLARKSLAGFVGELPKPQ